ncbi:FAD dependent oxidoreductase [Lasiodiplodia theobromae]|uniref:Gamma-glutamylputrescine oxidoreductase n=1 Tax=Lasiodiplodia theobromae TaxID=45133 RepID=A0A5N5D3A3_9PEZI|nr:FAD dependent oxidoreductase [Lasiodiplodia theobromae]KAB2571872.1 Gamma-glutamylputrescine oxidoreductase [Lasiodiplodia theobromae]KAF4539042.1 FAD dependent oxidoreductase [Lasiodiplodia theobromae]KAF9637267.1 FAD dependent oxidoreductase [Lasiodiplodia theobromae]
MASEDLLFRVSSLLEADPGLPHSQPTAAFWQSPPHELPAPNSTQLPSAATTVVIGSGITACSLVKALLEKDPNADIVVCEARGLSSGATGRNGGHLVSSAVADFSSLQATFGTEMAVKIACFTLENVERMFEVAKELGPEIEAASELRRVDKVLALRDAEAVEKLRKSMEAFEKSMPEKWKGQMKLVGKVELEERYKLRNVAGGGIVKGGALWPYRLICRAWSHLLTQNPSRLRIETQTPVTSVTSNSDPAYPYLITTSRGAISAKEVVHCTNGHTGHLLPRLRGTLFPLRGTMTVQDCGQSFPKEGDSRTLSFYGTVQFDCVTEVFDLGLHYMQQNAVTGDIFIGGETARATDLLNSDDSRVSESSIKTLENVLPEEFRDEVFEKDDQGGPHVKSKWSGIMGFTADGVPLVGRLPKAATGRTSNGEWIAAGFNGYGMGNCWLTGEALAGMMRGEDVSASLPECYLATEDRLSSLGADRAAERLFGY